MDILESVISSLTSDEVRRFKILSNRFKADEEKKLLILFDGIRADKNGEQENQLLYELYGDNTPKTRNRYYRLRNKLLDNIEKSLVFYHFKYKDSIHAYYDIQLSIMFRERGQYRLSLYFLKKAEKKARDLDQFNILEQIYEEYTQLAIKDVEIDIDSILERRKANLEKIVIKRKNTEAIAVITQKLKKSNFSRNRETVIQILDKIRADVEKSAEIFHSAEGKTQIFRTVSALLLQKKAYDQLSEYLQATLKEFEEQNLFSNNNHDVRLLMLLWRTISLFKVYRFNEANDQLEVFEKEMKAYGRQNYFTYLFNYYNVKVNLMKSMGEAEEAAKLIRQALKQKEIKSNDTNELFLRISLADHLFNTGNFEEACGTIAGIRANEDYASLDDENRMFLEIFEMVNRFEAGDYAFINDRFKPFKKEFKKLLKLEENARTVRFMEILVRMNNAAVEGKRVSLRAALKGFREMFDKYEHGDNEIIMYDLYLRARLEEKPYYDLFLQRMKNLEA